jgi:hypothetical protein
MMIGPALAMNLFQPKVKASPMPAAPVSPPLGAGAAAPAAGG